MEDNTSLVFPNSLISDSPKSLLEKQEHDFQEIQSELLGMRVELSDTPSSESLVKLYEIQAKGRAYFERSSELFRRYLKYSSAISLLAQQAERKYKLISANAADWLRRNNSLEYKATKSGQEREAMVENLIPSNLHQELISWQNLDAQAKVNYQIIKSYMEQFKSVREDILVQLSIIKNLIMLGDLKIDPEAIRAFRVIEASYRPTQQDMSENFNSQVSECKYEEGPLQL